jgi:hypothetical protein
MSSSKQKAQETTPDTPTTAPVNSSFSASEAGEGANAPEPVNAAKSVTATKVYCKLPHGIVFSIGAVKVELKGGLDKNAVAGFGVTDIDSDLWEAIAKTYAKHPSIVKQLIFARKSDGESQAKELKAEKTGFEGLDPDKPSDGIIPDKEATR